MVEWTHPADLPTTTAPNGRTFDRVGIGPVVTTAEHAQQAAEWAESCYAGLVDFTPYGFILLATHYTSEGEYDKAAVAAGGGALGWWARKTPADEVVENTARKLDNVAPRSIGAKTWQEYEAGVRGLYGEASFGSRKYKTIVDGKVVNGVADNVATIGGRNVAVEAKRLTNNRYRRSVSWHGI